MRSLAFLIAALCLVLTAPVLALEEDRILQEESGEPSMAPPVEEDTVIPTMTMAPSMAAAGGMETSMPTEEPTSSSFKTATAVAGAATLCAFAGLF